MAKYSVACTKSITIVLGIEADSQEQAEEFASQQADFENYSGSDFDYSAELCTDEEFEELTE